MFAGYPDPFTEPCVSRPPKEEATVCPPGGSHCGSAEEAFPPTSPLTPTQRSHHQQLMLQQQQQHYLLQQQQYLLQQEQQQSLVMGVQHMQVAGDYSGISSQPASLCRLDYTVSDQQPQPVSPLSRPIYSQQGHVACGDLPPPPPPPRPDLHQTLDEESNLDLSPVPPERSTSLHRRIVSDSLPLTRLVISLSISVLSTLRFNTN